MFRHAIRPLAALLVVASLATAAGAQEIAKDHLASARAAIEASKVAEGFDNILVGVASQVKATLTRTNPALGSQIEDVTNKVAIDFAARRPDLDKQIQTIWAKTFTKAELDEISKFYNSPTGKKLASQTQGMVQQSMQTVVAWQQQLSTDMLAKVREEFKKRGQNL